MRQSETTQESLRQLETIYIGTWDSSREIWGNLRQLKTTPDKLGGTQYKYGESHKNSRGG